jgi:hypothetical protein
VLPVAQRSATALRSECRIADGARQRRKKRNHQISLPATRRRQTLVFCGDSDTAVTRIRRRLGDCGDAIAGFASGTFASPAPASGPPEQCNMQALVHIRIHALVLCTTAAGRAVTRCLHGALSSSAAGIGAILRCSPPSRLACCAAAADLHACIHWRTHAYTCMCSTRSRRDSAPCNSALAPRVAVRPAAIKRRATTYRVKGEEQRSRGKGSV